MNIEKCDVCGNIVRVDQWGNGKCSMCGWYQNKDCARFPKVANPPNFISLSKANDIIKRQKVFAHVQ